MAIYNLDNYKAADGLGFPLNFRRGNPNPLDNSSVWASLAAAENYAKTDPTAYVGQPLTVIETVVTGDVTDTIAVMYTIQNEAGDLGRVGTITLGDDVTIVKNADNTLSIKGYSEAAAGAQLVKTENGMEWVVPSTETVDGIKTAVETLQDRADAADTKMQANEDAITKLNANAETEGSVDYKIAQAVAQILENPDETMNSINELVTWCNEHAEDALALSNQVTQDGKDIDALEALVGSTAVATQITDAIAAALKIDGVDKYALATDLTAAIARIAALELKSHEHANKALLDTYDQSNADIKDAIAKKHNHANASIIDSLSAEKLAQWDAAEQNAKDHADELNAEMDERMQIVEGEKHTHENAEELAKIAAGDKAKWDAAEQNAKDFAQGLDDAMDERMQVVEGKAHEHANKDLLDTYTQTEANLADAVAKKHEHANAAELAKIADGDKAKWDAAQANAEKTAADALALAKEELSGDIVAAQEAAEKVANDNNVAMDNRVKVLEAIDHEAYKAYADQAETDAITSANAYADGLAVNYDAAGSAADAEANAKAYADEQITAAAMAWGEF